MIKMGQGLIERLKNSNNSFINAIISHAPKYFSSSIIGALIGLIMNKYYTHVFSPEEFGVLALYLMLFQYMQNLVAFTIETSSQRIYFENNEDKLNSFFGTIFLCMLVTTTFWCVISFFIQDIFISYFGGDRTLFWVTIFLSIVMVYISFFNRISYNRDLSNLIFKQSLLQAVINHMVSVMLIQFNFGIVGRQIGQLVSAIVNFVLYANYLVTKGFMSFKLNFNRQIFNRIVYFALPSFLNAFLVATFSYLDRAFLQYFHGAKEVGIYSLALIIGQGISMVIEAISLSLFATTIRELENNYNGAIEKLIKVDKIFFCALMVITGLICLTSESIIDIISNDNYKDAAGVLIFIAFGTMMGGLYKNVSTVIIYHSKVWYFPVISFISYGVTAIINFILIPIFNELGAAFSFFCGIYIYSLLQQLVGCKYFHSLRYILSIYLGIFSLVLVLFLIKIRF